MRSSVEKKKPGSSKPLPGGIAKLPRHLDDHRYIACGSGESLNRRHLTRNSLREQAAHRLVELPQHFGTVGGQIELTPAQSFRAVHQNLDRARHAALCIKGQFGGVCSDSILREV